MTSYLLSGPALEPVLLAEAKVFLRVDDTVEDDFITTLITAARLHVEGMTGRALIAQSWRVVCDNWPRDRIIKLPTGPVISLSAVTVYDVDGAATSLPLAQFHPETEVAPARLFLPGVMANTPILRERAAIEIDYVAGFGVDASDVPTDLKQAILSLIGYWYEHRDAVVIAGSGCVVPTGFDQLVAKYRNIRL